MGKIRVQDLARMMGVANQDLLFKLRSIGVRVEGEEAAIDKEVIEAILKGKRLRQPREVILRDDSTKKAPSQGPRKPARPPAPTPPLRSPRRKMIQRVESRIHNIEVKDRKADSPQEMTAPPQVAAEATTVEATPTIQQPTVAAQAPVTVEDQVPVEVKAEVQPSVEAKAEEVVQPPVPAEKPSEKAAKGTKAASTSTAKAESAQPKKPVEATAKEVEKPKPEVVKGRPRSTKARAVLIEKGTGEKTTAAKPGRRPPSRSDRPGTRSDGPPSSDNWSGRGRGKRGRQDSRQRGGGAGRRRQSDEPQQAPQKPSSARGHRRSERRQGSEGITGNAIQFKEARPDGPVMISEGMTVRDFAEKLGVKVKDLIKALFSRGIMANINHVLDNETAAQVAEELGVEVMEVSFEEEVQLRHESEEGESIERSLRAPVITVMGHVDHGKTTLLDSIRSANVASGEAGGITQHVAAYHVDVGDNQIVFLDTPGHEAFTMMRARGAKVTDIVVLVVAADDSVMPQTIEAIDHAKAAGVPIIVAINKIDKPNANLDRVKKELADQSLLVEDWGGETVAVPLSALKQEGITELLEMLLLTSDMLDLKASPALPAQGAVIEARKEIGRGNVATILVQDGTLSNGDIFVAGPAWGRVRSMTDDRGERIDIAGPSTPVEVTGFNTLPAAGDIFQVLGSEAEARNIAEFRQRENRQRELAPNPGRLSLEQLFSQIQESETKELPIIIKADVQGSVEVLKDTLVKLSTEKVKVKVLHASVGAVTTNDVILASASNAIVVGFNVRPERNAAALAEKEQVDIRLHTVIYELSDELKRAMTGLLEPDFKEVHKGTAEVRETFSVPRVGVIAGCYITDGTIPRTAGVRLLRDNRVIYEGKIGSLRRFKDDVAEVRTGFECGIGLENFQDIKPGDSIEAFVREEVQPTL